MKKQVLAMLFTAAISASAFANETVKMAIGEWAPYTSATDMSGNLVEKIVTEAFKLEGVDVKYDYFPWKRSYENVKNGEYDGTFPWNKTDERNQDFYIHKISLVKDDSVYFHLKSVPFEWNTMDDLKKYKVGVTIGYKEEGIYKQHGITAYPVSSEEQNFKKILDGKIDVYQTSKVVGYSMIKKLFTPEQVAQFTNNAKATEVNEYYVLFSKKTPNGQALADKLDAGLQKLKDSGEYDKILATYIGNTK